MAGFRFPLEPLLKARRAKEREHQRAVAVLERQRLELEDRLRRQQGQIIAAKSVMRDRLVGDLQIDSLRAQANVSLKATRSAQQIVLELAGLHKRLDAARVRLSEAMRDRRAMELLKERRLQQWKDDQNKAEQAALDELAVAWAAQREDRP